MNSRFWHWNNHRRIINLDHIVEIWCIGERPNRVQNIRLSTGVVERLTEEEYESLVLLLRSEGRRG